MQIWDTSAELPFVSWNWTSLNHTMVANSSKKLKHFIAEGWTPSLTPFLAVSKLSETFVRQTWKWNAMLSTSRNQTFCCPIFLLRFPLWQKQCLCVHIGQWYWKHHSLPFKGGRAFSSPGNPHSEAKSSETKGHCPSHQRDQQKHSLAHGPSQQLRLWQLSQPGLPKLGTMFTMAWLWSFL